jgi:phosphatidylglycerol:prolipoprotein diacylglycerol transferase
MCSELFRIPLEYHGVPIFGVGVLLGVWALVSAWGLRSTAKEAGMSAALWAHLPTILIVAAAIAVGIPRYFPDGVPIRGYGVMVLAGSITGILMALRRARQANLGPDEIAGLAVALFVSGIIGARLFFVIEYWDSIRGKDAWTTLKNALSYTEGGLVVYGAFIGAMLGFTWYTSRRGLPALAMADLIAPSMLAGLALGRIGCLLNGCCYGGESDVPWAVQFPRERSPGHLSAPFADQAAAGRFYGLRLRQGDGEHAAAVASVDAGRAAAIAGLKPGDAIASINGASPKSLDGVESLLIESLADERSLEIRTGAGQTHMIAALKPPPDRSLPVHPAQVYASITAGLLAWLLWSYYPYRRREGEVTALMITLYPIARFCEEIIRVDEPEVFRTGLSISQNISIGLLAVAAGLWLWIRRNPAGRLDFPLPMPSAA